MSKYSVGQKRGQVAYDNRDPKGGGSKSALDLSKTTLRLFKPVLEGGGYNSFDIIPYIIRGGQLTVEQRNAGLAVGNLEFILNYFIHRNCGPANQTLICMKKTFGHAHCSGCDEAEAAYTAKDNAAGGRLKASPRSCMVIRPAGPNGPQPPMVFDVSHKLFTKELMEKAAVVTRGAGLLQFYEPGNAGRLIECRAVESAEGKSKNRKYTEFKDFSFYDRQNCPVTDAEVEAAPCLNSLLMPITKEQFDAIYYGSDVPEDATPVNPPPSYGGTPDHSAQPDHGQATPPAQQAGWRPGQATQAPTYQPPAQTHQQAPSQPAEPQSPVYQSPPSQPAAAEAVTSCPHGYTFGADCDKRDLCAKCPATIWRACDKANK